jgi:leucyl/phenylalanyl-tRNA---protein transferase
MSAFYIPNEGKPVDFNEFEYTMPDEDGLVCVGANFHPQTLVSAYMHGLFPWFIHDGLPFWYCPDPRMVLLPAKLTISKSMRKVLDRNTFTITCDTAFDLVIKNCAHVVRKGSFETWIDTDFIRAYNQLHHYGIAHSFEAWQQNELVGGLYGVSIGEVFFGESMFASITNASKAAFITGVKFLESKQFKMIDCQVGTAHLKSLGAEDMSRLKFLKLLSFDVLPPSLNNQCWTSLFQTYLSR